MIKLIKELEIKTIEMVGVTILTVGAWILFESIPTIYKMLFLY